MVNKMKVSIITATYNSAFTISDTLQSLNAQSYLDIEHIIIDGASKDNTLDLVRQQCSRVTKIICEPDRGIYDAMNKGLALASGDVIGILNSDDFYLHEDTIAEVVKAFEANPGVDMVLGNVDFVRPDDLTRPSRFYSSFNFVSWKMRFGFMPAHPAAFIKYSAYERVGNYKLDYKIGADFEWFVRALVVHRLPHIKLNQTLVRMREGGVSTSGLKSYLVSSKEQLRALRENGVVSNILFVLVRLPIKLFQKFFVKVK